MDEFYVIKIKNKNVFLCCEDRVNKMVWEINKNDACYFNTEKEARTFAAKYFKRFTNYEIQVLFVNIENIID